MKFLNHILILSALALGACSETVSEPEVSPAACTISIVLRHGGMQPDGAADGSPDAFPDGTWGDKYDESYYYPSESVIDNIHFFVRRKDGTTRALQAQLVTEGSAVMTYKAEIALDDELIERRGGKLYFSGEVLGITNYSETINSPYDNNPFSIAKVNLTGETGGNIPMWGVAHLDGLMLDEENVTLAGDIYMLRSVPRITFMLHDDVKSLFRIKSIVPDRADYPATANVFPTGGKESTDTRQLFRETCFNPAETSETAAPHFYTAPDNSTWYTYVAERNCGLVDGAPLGFTVTLEEIAGTADGKHRSFSGKVYLCDYSDGQPVFSSPYPNLVRNHDYRFIINLTPLDFLVSVEKWIPGGRYNIDFDF